MKLEQEDIRPGCEWIEDQDRTITWASIVRICPALIDKEFTRIALIKPVILKTKRGQNERMSEHRK